MEDLFKYLNRYVLFSASEKSEILNYLEIILNKKNLSYDKIKTDLEKIVSGKIPHKLKRQKVRSYLRKICYPLLSSCEEEFKKKAENLEKKIKNVKFIPPLNFEKNTFEIVITYKGREDFEKTLEKIKSNISEIFELEEIVKCEDIDL